MKTFKEYTEAQQPNYSSGTPLQPRTPYQLSQQIWALQKGSRNIARDFGYNSPTGKLLLEVEHVLQQAKIFVDNVDEADRFKDSLDQASDV